MPALYRELVDRFMRALADYKSGTTDKEWREDLHPRRSDGKFGHGEVPGSAGPDDVDELPEGPKPEKVEGKTSKERLYQLLSSGHAFTKEELMRIADVPTEQRLNSFMSFFKNPKYAAPRKALDLRKNKDGTYQVYQEGTETPAPPVPPPAPKPEVKKAEKPVLKPSMEEARDWWTRARQVERERLLDEMGYPHSKGWIAQRPFADLSEKMQERLAGIANHSTWKNPTSKPLWKAPPSVHTPAHVGPKEFAKFDPGEHATAGSIGRWLEKHNYADKADFGKLDVAVAAEHAKSMEDHYKEFPELRKNSEFVGSAQEHIKMDAEKQRERVRKHLGTQALPAQVEARVQPIQVKSTTWAYAAAPSFLYKGRSCVVINEAYGSSENAWRLRQGLRRCVESGFHPPGCNTVKSIVDHEYGHQLDTLLNLDTNPAVLDLLAEAKGGLPRGKGLEKFRLKAAVSEYATENTKEFIAECWAEFKNNPAPRPIASKLAAIIRSEHARQFPKQAIATATGQAVPA